MAAADTEESPVVYLSNQYKIEFNDLRQRTLQLSDSLYAKACAYQEQLRDIQPAINREKDELLATLQDQSEITAMDHDRMLATFTWAGVMLTGMTAGCIFARYMLAPLLSFFVSEFYASIAVYLVAPYIAFRYFTGPIEGDFKEVDRYRRHSLLALSTVVGVLKGFLFSGRVLPGIAPPSFIAPLSIGVVSLFASPYIANDRMKMLAVTVGTSVAVHLCVGMTAGFSLGFVVLMIAYAVAQFGMVQMYLKYGDGDNKTHAYQVAYLLAVVYSQAVVFSLFTMDANQFSETN
ncbi:hypothetical protein Tcan_08246 [Toxocara canis]|uniref:Uncharacterized protein n=2 Tax=Toxocara canis TaxID=6265 RepID=A0A0B2V699_TOXCA|nr:hypothetical protein Tcan_08246 [Toxocara canis]VDM23522.1 unnamed protein product [Toxocara canis]